MQYEINTFDVYEHAELIMEFYKPFWKERTGKEDMCIDLLQIETMQKAGALISAFGVDRDKQLQAAYLGFAHASLYDYRIISSQEILWGLSPEKRTGKNFINFMKAIYDCNEGVDEINITVPHGNDKATSALHKLGFKVQDSNFIKYKDN